MSSFPALYAVSSTDKKKVWNVRVVQEESGEAVIFTSHGYVDGKITETSRRISTGKNLGKKNETTPLQQALAEAGAAWNKKKDAGYGETCISDNADANSATSDSENGEQSSLSIPLPMLALDYNKRGKDIAFPCFAQRKLDGVRCVAISGKGLFSRNSKPFPGLQEIKKEINSLLPPGSILDGELYSDVLGFQELVGLVKKIKLNADDIEKQKLVYLCVYDIIQNESTNAQRNASLELMFKKQDFKTLRLLPTEICQTPSNVLSLHNKYVEEGYEGLILRNMKGLYKMGGYRSADLQKYKQFQDDEYQIVGFQEGEGVEIGCIIWKCVTKEGITFNCRPKGTHEARRELFKNAQQYVGKKLTVRFQELSDDLVPRFPVGITIRDYE